MFRKVCVGWIFAAATTILASLSACELSPAATDGFRPLFNGKDLTGWVNVNCAPETFFVKDGVIITTGKPTGYMRTDRQYENFIVEFEWMHINKDKVGNSGFFVWGDALPAQGTPFTRGIEVQVLVNLEKEGAYTSHGDVFAIQGATCKPDRPHPKGAMRSLPSERRAKGGGEWNHYRIEANNGAIKLAVNGKEVSGVSECKPRKGYLALEAEGAECHFKNLKIKELPSSATPAQFASSGRLLRGRFFPRFARSVEIVPAGPPLPADQVADVDTGFKSIYTGLDLRGWKADAKNEGHWQQRDWILHYDGKGTDLWSAKDYGNFELRFDWRFLKENAKKMKRPVILPSGEYAVENGKQKEIEVLDAGDSGIYLRGSSKSQVNLWCWPVGSGEIYGYRTDKNMPPAVRAGVTPKVNADKPPGQWNRMLITMRGDRLTVVSNGQKVIDNAQLPGVSPRGPIALQHHGDVIQFANLFIRELN